MTTAQELFNKVVAHLRAQGKQSFDKNGSCAYRGEDGLKCAIGCLIEDKEYHERMEGGSIDDVILSYGPISLQDRLHPHLNLLIDLQHCHDDSAPRYWEDDFNEIAKKYKLTHSPKAE